MSFYAVNQKDPKFIFIINYKVMYSSFDKILPQHFPEVRFYNKSQVSKAKIRFKDYPKFAIVRNPFSRAVSAYYGKCIKAPKKNLFDKNAQLQYCQLQLLNTIQEVRNEAFDIAQPAIHYNLAEHSKERNLLNQNFNTLIDISFEEYVKCMKIILKKKDADGHFRKQYDMFTVLNQKKFFFPYNVYKNTKIIKLENIAQDWNLICQELGKEMDLLKVNKTDDVRASFETFYTAETRKKIAKLYKTDFIKFGYTTHF